MKALLLTLALLGPVQSVDDAVRAQVQRFRTPAGSRVFQEVSDTARGITVIGAMLAIAVLDRSGGAATVLRTIVALAPANLAVEIVKRTTQRVRPDGERKRSNSSFPSSHAANAAVIAVVLSRRWPKLTAAFTGLALLVAWSRIYLDRHWLSDVLVGLAIGAAAAWLVSRWLPSRIPLRRRDRAPKTLDEASSPRADGA